MADKRGAMLDKTFAAVGCAHCQGKGAELACRWCRALICRDCQQQGSCPRVQPSMRRLALGTVLYDVDRGGRAGLSRRGQRELSAIELETGLQTFLGVRVPPGADVERALPRLITLADGSVQVLAYGAPGVIERVAIGAGAARDVAGAAAADGAS
ncbi:MAG: hypothetical protein KC503_34095, partial [Myxococcales bacterium]|nr:hypothetical protein [Myxococcales bacterium]